MRKVRKVRRCVRGGRGRAQGTAGAGSRETRSVLVLARARVHGREGVTHGPDNVHDPHRVCARKRGGAGQWSMVSGQRSADASAGRTEERHGVHAEHGAAEVHLAEGCRGRANERAKE